MRWHFARQRGSALLTSAVLAAWSCTTPQAPQSRRATVRDSAGVQLADFDSLPAGEGLLRVESSPYLTLGGLHENDSLEFDVRGQYLSSAELVSGGIVVGDHQRLKFYSARGQLRRIVGRTGHGPGEFSSVRDLCPQADSSLVVIDDDGRISRWSAQGDHLGTYERPGFIPRFGCTAGGGLVVQTARAGEPEFARNVRRLQRTSLTDVRGSKRALLGDLPAPEYFGQIFFEPGYAVTDRRLLVGDPRTFEVREYDTAHGRLVRRWSVRNALRELNSATWDSLLALSIPRNATAEQRQRIVNARERVGNPGVIPAFHRMLVDNDQRIWMSRYFDSRRWLVIDSGGMRLSQFVVPVDSTCRPDVVGFSRAGPIVRLVDEHGAPVLRFYAWRRG